MVHGRRAARFAARREHRRRPDGAHARGVALRARDRLAQRSRTTMCHPRPFRAYRRNKSPRMTLLQGAMRTGGSTTTRTRCSAGSSTRRTMPPGAFSRASASDCTTPTRTARQPGQRLASTSFTTTPPREVILIQYKRMDKDGSTARQGRRTAASVGADEVGGPLHSQGRPRSATNSGWSGTRPGSRSTRWRTYIPQTSDMIPGMYFPRDQLQGEEVSS